MERTVTVVPEAGLHARPASRFVQAANRFEADLEVGPADADDLVNARSMLSVTSLGVECGDDVRIVAEGSDAGAALDALEEVLSTPEHDDDEGDESEREGGQSEREGGVGERGGDGDDRGESGDGEG